MSSQKLILLALALTVACDQGVTPNGHGSTSAPAATVTLTSVAFADDCGGTPPSQAPPASPAVPEKNAVAAPATRANRPSEQDDKPSRRRCEQTSMQLSIVATRTTDVRVKSVEVFDEHGASLGVLRSSSPTRWSDGEAAYKPWDETIAAGQTARVSYVLQQPSFVSSYDERDRTYSVKVVASVGGIAQPLQTTVMVVARPAPVPT